MTNRHVHKQQNRAETHNWFQPDSYLTTASFADNGKSLMSDWLQTDDNGLIWPSPAA